MMDKAKEQFEAWWKSDANELRDNEFTHSYEFCEEGWLACNEMWEKKVHDLKIENQNLLQQKLAMMALGNKQPEEAIQEIVSLQSQLTAKDAQIEALKANNKVLMDKLLITENEQILNAAKENAALQQQISELQEEYRRLQGVDNDNKALEYMVVKQADQITQLQSTVRRYERALNNIATRTCIDKHEAANGKCIYGQQQCFVTQAKEALTESSHTTGEKED